MSNNQVKSKKEWTEEELEGFAQHDVADGVITKFMSKSGNWIVSKRNLELMLESMKDSNDRIVVFEGEMFNRFNGEKKRVLKYFEIETVK